MTLVSRRLLNKDVEKRINDLFIQAIVDLNKEIDVVEFLEEFLSPTEKIILSKRLAIAFLLVKKYDYDAIKETLKVTSATISKVNLWMKYKGKGYYKVINIINSSEKWQEFWNKMDYYIGRLMVMQKGANWARRRKVVEEKYLKNQKPF